jgi:hypothetical protein
MSKQNVAYELLNGQYGIGLERVIQTVSYDEFTDGGGADGTLALSTTIPAGSVGLFTKVDVTTAFTSDSDTSTAVMNVGDGSDDDKFSYTTFNVFVAATGLMEQHDAAASGTETGLSLITSDATITLTITEDSDWGQITQGELTVAIYYMPTANLT